MSNNEAKDESIEKDNNNYESDFTFKIIIIGDLSVGKSSIAVKAIRDYFDDYYSPTIGFEFFNYTTKVDGKNIKLQIWDTCGQEAYKSLITSFYRNSSLAIIVYAIDNQLSFQNIEVWLNEIKTYSNPNIKVVLIGNKCDLEDKRAIKKEEGEKFSQEHNLNLFMETSAKSGLNTKDLFNIAAKILYEEYKNLKEKAELPEEENKSQSLTASNSSLPSVTVDNKKDKKCFC